MAGHFETLRDGRHERTDRSRRAVVLAALELIRETGEHPSGESIAARAGVSRRTVFRLFSDIESLHVAVIEFQEAEVMRRFPAPLDVEAPLPARIAAVAKHRAGVYEFIMPIRRVAESSRDTSPSIARSVVEARNNFRVHLELMFGDVLGALERGPRDELAHALELVTCWASWRTLRDDQHCSAARARRIVETSLRRILA